MTARVFIGSKNGQYGLWASPPSVNAQTAPDSSLIMQMTNLTDQIILTGYAPGSTTVPLGLSARPIILLITRGFRSGFGNCAVRPCPMGSDTNSCSATVSASALSIFAPQPCMYQVFRRIF